MQTNDASTQIMFKFWPWFEANRQRLIIGTVVLVVAFFVWFFFHTQRQQKELAAGQAYTQLMLNQATASSAAQLADSYLKIANQYSGTMAAQRAQLEAATLMFTAANYDGALAQFKSFLVAHVGGSLAPAARMGMAACLESSGKLDEALSEYRVVTTTYPDANEALLAKFSMGRILELQGKLNEAISAYQDVTRSPLAGSLAQEAGQRIALMQIKLAAARPATPAAPATPTTKS